MNQSPWNDCTMRNEVESIVSPGRGNGEGGLIHSKSGTFSSFTADSPMTVSIHSGLLNLRYPQFRSPFHPATTTTRDLERRVF